MAGQTEEKRSKLKKAAEEKRSKLKKAAAELKRVQAPVHHTGYRQGKLGPFEYTVDKYSMVILKDGEEVASFTSVTDDVDLEDLAQMYVRGALVGEGMKP